MVSDFTSDREQINALVPATGITMIPYAARGVVIRRLSIESLAYQVWSTLFYYSFPPAHHKAFNPSKFQRIGCPVFVPGNKIHAGHNLPKWEVLTLASPFNILNLRTGYLSPQCFHHVALGNLSPFITRMAKGLWLQNTTSQQLWPSRCWSRKSRGHATSITTIGAKAIHEFDLESGKVLEGEDLKHHNPLKGRTKPARKAGSPSNLLFTNRVLPTSCASKYYRVL